jgi:two-component system, LytTR family, sensor histidine kinase AlgZ
MAERPRQLLALIDRELLLTSVVVALILVGYLGIEVRLSVTTAVLVAVPLALFIAQLARTSRFLLWGRAFSAARRYLTTAALTVGSIASGLLAGGALVLLLRVFGSPSPLGTTVFVGGGLGVSAFLLSAAFRILSEQDSEREEAQRDALVAELRAKEAELSALSARVSPHFLFNSLNSIAALCRKDPKGAERMCIDLAELLRERLDLSGREWVTVLDELETIRRYLSIEKVRFLDRLEVIEKINPVVLNLPMPKLSLQPLVENAVKHGIARLSEGGCIEIEADWIDGTLVFRITNPTPEEARKRTPGHGIRLVRERLAFLTEGRSSLTTKPEQGVFVCELRLPDGQA